MASISASVGRGGVNRPEDVKTIQQLLNLKLQPSPKLDEDGKIGTQTLLAIQSFQSNVVHLVRPDGKIDPGGKTFTALNEAAGAAEPSPAAVAKPSPATTTGLPPVNPNRGILSDADFVRAAAALNCEVACVRAVTVVEAGKTGYFPSGRPKILFEAHYFGRLTGHRFDASHPNISSPKWNRALYKGGEKEYDRLLEALALDREAALKSASWGLFQIMGDNYKASGFASVDDYVKAMYESEGRQLDAFIGFVKSSEKSLAAPLREKRWADFASHYNGPSYAQNHYDAKLKDAYDKFA